MCSGVRKSLLGLVSLALASCAGPGDQEGRFAHSDRTELLARLQLGQPVLDCRDRCLNAWIRVEPTAMQLDAAAKWDDLAVLVIRSGYQDDLSLYYLGRAAEGRKFYAAAAAYYRQSAQLSGTSVSCANLSHLCGGATLPKSTYERLAAVGRYLVSPRKRSRQPETASRLPATVTTEEPAAAVDPTQNATPEPPAAAGDTDTTDASEYIEPPPVSRQLRSGQ